MLALYIYGVVLATILGIFSVLTGDEDSDCKLSNIICIFIVLIIATGSWLAVSAYLVDTTLKYIRK